MYIGDLSSRADFSYTHIGVNVPCPPKSTSNGVSTWCWDDLYETGFDINADLHRNCYVGSVTLDLKNGSRISGFDVLVNGETVGGYRAETGKTVSGKLCAPVGVFTDKLTVRIRSDLFDVSVTAPEIVGYYDDGAPLLWPQAKKASFRDGSVRIRSVRTHSNCDDELAAAAFLRERLVERYGACFDENGVDVTLVSSPDGEYKNERYTVNIDSTGINVTAGARISLMYAVCKLLELGDNGSFRLCDIDDAPTKSMRGFHMGLPSNGNIGFAKRLFRYVLLPLGYNTLFIEFCGGMRFDKHPEISEKWLEKSALAKAGLQPPDPHEYMGAEGELLEKATVAELIEYAKSYGFEIIPEVQSLGHVQYITYAHPEIAEPSETDDEVKDTRGEDARPDARFSHCYCPSNEKSYEIIFDIIDEIVEVSKPQRYVHIGHDEVYYLGMCKKCKNTPPDVLLANDINRMYNYIKSKGLGTAIWSDMLQPVTKYKTHNATKLIPKDILCLDFIWYFHFDLDIENNISEQGFPTVIGNLYSSHFPRYRSRMLKDGVIGGEVSTWCALNEYRLAKKGKLYELTYTAQLLWNPEDHLDSLREAYAHIITDRIQDIQRDELRGKYRAEGYTPTDIGFEKTADAPLPEAILHFRPDAALAENAVARIGLRCDRLLIEHTTLHSAPRKPWQELYLCGTYTVTYEDGEREELRAEYMGNIQSYDRRYADPLRGQLHRHTGYVGTWFSSPTLEEKYGGEDVLLTSYVWENPHPEKTLATLTYRSADGDYTRAVLTRLTALSANTSETKK